MNHAESTVIRLFHDDDRDARAVLLNNLNEWFGMYEANAAYIDSLGRLPTAVGGI